MSLRPIPIRGCYALRIEAKFAPPWAVHDRTGKLDRYVSDTWFADDGGWEPAVLVPVHGWAPLDGARAAVMHGVTWDGSYESISGVSKDEALEFAADLIGTIDQLGGAA